MELQLPEVGEVVVGRYLVEEVLRQEAGHMENTFAVFGVHDKLAGVARTLKVLQPAAFRQDPTHAARFAREIRLLFRLRNPHTLVIHDNGELASGLPWYVAERLQGETLAELLKSGPLDLAEVRRLALHVLSALAELHERRLLHRDLKPGHLFRTTRDGRPFYKLIGFGLARSEQLEAALRSTQVITGPAVLVGTDIYMAPELWDGQPPSPRSDIYALGLTLALACSCEFIVAPGSIAQVMRGHLGPGEHTLPARARRSQLGPILARAIRKRPEERFSSAAELFQALAALGPELHEGPVTVAEPESATLAAPPQTAPAGAEPTVVQPVTRPGAPGAAPGPDPEAGDTDPELPVALPAAPGEVVAARYELLELLWEEGHTQTFRALHLALGRPVLLTRAAPDAPPEVRWQLERQAAFAGRLYHPVALLPLDQGEDRVGVPFLVTDLPEGEPLSLRLTAGRTLEDEPLRAITLQLLAVLDASHRVGLLHGDLRAEQILLWPPTGRQPVVRLRGWRGVELPAAEPARGEAIRRELRDLGRLLAAARSGQEPPVRDRELPVSAATFQGSLGQVVQDALLGRAASARELLARLDDADGGTIRIRTTPLPPPAPPAPAAPPSAPAAPPDPGPERAALELRVRQEVLRELLRLRLPLLTPAQQRVVDSWHERADLDAILRVVLTQGDPDLLRRALFPVGG